jgi:sugar phosphate isomerase/epimerase
MLRSGLVSITFRALSPVDIIGLVRETGLEGIEWGGDVHAPHGDEKKAEEVGRRTREAGLQVAAYGSYYKAGKSETEGLSFEAVLASAKALGAPTIRVWAGPKGSAESDENLRVQVEEDLQRISIRAAADNITISLEYHNGTLTDTLESTVALLQKVNHPALRTYWQPVHGRPTEEGVHQLLTLAAWLTNLHAFHWWPTHAERWPLADGAARWREFLQTAAELKGDRFVMLEFVQNDDVAQFRQDAATLRAWLASI